MEGCFFCDRQAGRRAVVGGAVYQDELVCATHMSAASEHSYLGYLAVQTRRHVHHWADLTDAEAMAVGLLCTRLSRGLKACLGVEHTYAVYYAEVVPHFHVLLTARYPDTPEAFWRGNVTDWPAAPRGGPLAVAALCDQLRRWLQEELAA